MEVHATLTVDGSDIVVHFPHGVSMPLMTVHGTVFSEHVKEAIRYTIFAGLAERVNKKEELDENGRPKPQ